MHFQHKTRSRTAWIAVFAILLGALMPALSHALSRIGGGETRWVEVCTVAGTKLVAVDDAGKSGSAELFPAERCAFCASHAGAPALPAPQLMPFVPKGDRDEFPTLHFHAPHLLSAWAPAHPRAPPLLG